MRIALYLRSQTVQCRYGGYFLGSAHSLRAAVPRLRDRYTQMRDALGRRGPGRSGVQTRGKDHA